MLAPGKRSGLGNTPALIAVEKVRAGVVYSTVALILTWANAWLAFLILWVLRLIPLNSLFEHWRTVAERRGLLNPEDAAAIRRVDASFYEGPIFALLAVNYHLDHHLFSGVPFYNLLQLQQRPLQEPIYCRNASIKAGCFARNGLFSEWVRAQNGTAGSAEGAKLA